MNLEFMKHAVSKAWEYQLLTYPNPAVGCCVVGENDEILAVQAHRKSGEAHAEVNALQAAYYKLTRDSHILSLESSRDIHSYLLSNHNNVFENVRLYTTLEPCSHFGKTPSCASLISELGIKEVYVGSNDSNPVAQNGNMILLKNNCTVYREVLLQECDDLLAPFNAWQKKNFVFFKWAQRLNGTTDGMEISSYESRENVHAMRDVCDLLVIGGNTVRTDRPTLDARLVSGKAPDILILSREKEFDQTIPLFLVKNRKVFIENNLSLLKQYNNIMIEGTSKMYELSRDYVTMYLCYIATKLGGEEIMNKNKDTFEVLNVLKETQDIIIWMKKEV